MAQRPPLLLRAAACRVDCGCYGQRYRSWGETLLVSGESHGWQWSCGIHRTTTVGTRIRGCIGHGAIETTVAGQNIVPIPAPMFTPTAAHRYEDFFVFVFHYLVIPGSLTTRHVATVF